jgi:hypothetical protein
MTKEMMFEDLLAPKRSAGASSEATAATSNNPVWHETGGLDVEQLKMGKSADMADGCLISLKWCFLFPPWPPPLPFTLKGLTRSTVKTEIRME